MPQILSCFLMLFLGHTCSDLKAWADLKTFLPHPTLSSCNADIQNVFCRCCLQAHACLRSILHACKKTECTMCGLAQVWHFYLGRPIIISELRPDGSLKETLLGNDFAAGQKPQYTILPDSWYGARTSEPNGTGPLADLQQVIMRCPKVQGMCRHREGGAYMRVSVSAQRAREAGHVTEPVHALCMSKSWLGVLLLPSARPHVHTAATDFTHLVYCCMSIMTFALHH